jgi:hypothetical protein
MLITQGEIEVAPSEVGYDRSRLEVLNRHFQSIYASGAFRCADSRTQGNRSDV